MLGRKRLYALLGAAGALVLLLGGLGGVSIVSAQEEVTPETEDAPTGEFRGWGRDLFGFGRGDPWTMFDTAAEILGLTPEELFAELHAGNSLEAVGEAQDVDLDAIQEALSAVREEAMRDAIEQAVEDGEMTQDEADWRLEGLEQGYMSGRGFGRGFGRGMRVRGGPGPSAPDEIAPQPEQQES
ncbi:MAG: hypothetical protein PVG25_10625 [Anaerolineae bacterium]|jgi:hypothetical protein